MTSPRPIEDAHTPDLRGSWPALLRAAQRARALAAQTGTALVILRDGVVEHLYPAPPVPAGRVEDDSPRYEERP